MNPPFEYELDVFDVIRNDPLGFALVIIAALILALYVNWRIG